MQTEHESSKLPELSEIQQTMDTYSIVEIVTYFYATNQSEQLETFKTLRNLLFWNRYGSCRQPFQMRHFPAILLLQIIGFS